MKKFIYILFLTLSTVIFAKCKNHEHQSFTYGSSIEANIVIPEFDRVIGRGRKPQKFILSSTNVMYVYYNGRSFDIIHKMNNKILISLNVIPSECDWYKNKI